MNPYIEDLVAVLEDGGDRPVLRHDGADTTAAELLAMIRRFARVLDGIGVGHGDLVALFAPHRPEPLAVRWAAHLVGAGAAYLPDPPDPGVRGATIAQFAPRLVVVVPETAEMVPADVGVPVASVGPVPGVATRLDELAAAASDAPFASRSRLGDLCAVVPSGGTTGVPKGSRRDVASYTVAVAGPRDPDRRQLANGSMAHLTQILVDQTLLGGGTVVLQDHYEPLATLDAVAAERITHLFLVEPQLFDLMDHPAVVTHDLRSLKVVTHIGANAAPVLRRRARQRLGKVVAHTYGASEIGIVSALSPAEHDRPSRFRCAGHVRPGVELRFRAPDGTLDPVGGEIEVRSAAMAQGYRNRPEDEAEHFVDGWYRTGDLGDVDGEGMLRVNGRAADRGGPDGVAIVDLQDTLCRVRSVRYAVPVAALDVGLRVVAALAWPGGEVDAAACVEAVAAEHGPQIAASLRILPTDRIPLTEQGKPDRPAIRAAAGLPVPASLTAHW